jgi:hypothetical protein
MLAISLVWSVMTLALHLVQYAVIAFSVDPHHLDKDRKQVSAQLGYMPSNFVAVVARSADSAPLVLQTYPLSGGSPRRQARNQFDSITLGTPFPTFYWLCHNEIGKAISHLERGGWVQRIETTILQDDALCDDLNECHRQYSLARWNSLSDSHREILRSMPSPRHILRDSGISGTNLTLVQQRIPSVKCLHAHYAQYRANTTITVVNPVGAYVHKLLQNEFPNLIL